MMSQARPPHILIIAAQLIRGTALCEPGPGPGMARSRRRGGRAGCGWLRGLMVTVCPAGGWP